MMRRRLVIERLRRCRRRWRHFCELLHELLLYWQNHHGLCSVSVQAVL